MNLAEEFVSGKEKYPGVGFGFTDKENGFIQWIGTMQDPVSCVSAFSFSDECTRA